MRFLTVLVLLLSGFSSIQAQTIYRTVQSGYWGDNSTWEGNIPPNYSNVEQNDQVIISANHTVSMDGEGTNFPDQTSLIIYGVLDMAWDINPSAIGGTLIFLEESTFTNFGQILMENGAFIISGGSSQFINHGVIHIDYQPNFSINFLSLIPAYNFGEISFTRDVFHSISIGSGQSGQNTLFTCDPPPEFVPGINNNNGILKAIPFGTPCGDGSDIWDGDCNCVNPPTVPTFSEWGIITLSFLILILGVVGVRQKAISSDHE